ncbi:MAG: TetM/TetW/TetO/TetS family tetracycline resistance ribosomal protection protein [Clostridiales bacterium]|nr:TetM/TetW/TetO/TetS family tetracycline resistance ribosomal protection protein [Clostridiales bacterium]
MGQKKIVLGVLAHVDAGKTTLAESMLYAGGEIRRPGRVDHKDAFLDTDVRERDRGITIFAKQACFCWKDMEVTLLDTPGHVDFSAEMERTLQVLDYAVLIISGADGVQGHTLTLWKLLERYHVPVFLFVNKMDQPGTDPRKLLAELKTGLDEGCVAFQYEERAREAFYENIAVTDELLLERYLEKEGADGGGLIDEDTIAELIRERKLFPCYFGSALKAEGVEDLLNGVWAYTRMPDYGVSFGARVFKIARDPQGVRLTYVKITGGSLKVKQTIPVRDADGGATSLEEKVDQIRVYSGSKYTLKQEAEAGCVCALAGPARTFCGEGLGAEKKITMPVLEPVMTYRLVLPEGCDVHQTYRRLCQLEEEEPQLHMVWREQTGEICVQLMGEVQIEILTSLILERFGVEVGFDEGRIVYKETIADVAEGVGHFEPLRHYAEVHLILEPGERGSGLQFRTACAEDVLDRNWQRLILAHLEEKEHLGVLTGSPITDMQITLASGRAHQKHTEGGDFRQATYRAVRQGLCRARSVLLEPVYEFRLELPEGLIGRAMTDIQAKGGRFGAPQSENGTAILTGTVPASQMHGYQTELLSYSGGKGRLFTFLKGYEPCHNAEEVIEAVGYEAERDPDNPCGSVFCAHGAGFVVEWDQVEDYMHLEPALVRGWKLQDGSLYGLGDASEGGKCGGTEYEEQASRYARRRPLHGGVSEDFIAQEEIDEIFSRTYGRKPVKKQGWARTIHAPSASGSVYRGTPQLQKEYLLVDGYNIIFAWDELRELARVSLDGARGKLMEMMSNFQACRGMELILVFDAYKVRGNPGSTVRYHNIDVVYTREAETADQYIEKVSHHMRGKYRVRVATSDGLEQLIIMGAGAVRVSAREFQQEVMAAGEELRQNFLASSQQPAGGKNYLLEGVDGEVAEYLEQMEVEEVNERDGESCGW